VAAAAASLLLASHASAQKRQDWDSFFERDESYPTFDAGDNCAPPRNGWQYSDGGFSAYHPGSTKKFFHHGDTDFYDAGLESNTMAVANNSVLIWQPPFENTWGDSSDIEFWARKGSGTWGTKEACGLGASNVTRPWMTTGWNNRWLWPNGQHVPSDTGQTNKMLGFWSMMRCQNNLAFGSCGTTEEGWVPITRAGAQATRFYVHQNVSGHVSTWADPTWTDVRNSNGASSTILECIEWGAAILQAAGSTTYYIFGVTIIPSGETGQCTDWDATPGEVVIAKATAATISDYNLWNFYMCTSPTCTASTGTGTWCSSTAQCQGAGGGAIPPVSASALKPVADEAAFNFTVDEVSFNSQKRFVLVQDRGALSNQIDYVAVRISNGSGTSATRTWPSITDTTHTWVGAIGNDTWSIDPPCDAKIYGTDPDQISLTAYSARAHWAFSDQSARKMLLSYYCPFVDYNKETGHGVSPLDVTGDGVCDPSDPAAYRRGDPLGPSNWEGGRLRFWDLDLTKLTPWCTTGCWM
jgi:hypothetical protein